LGTRVPLLIAGPGVPTSKQLEAFVNLADLGPTFLDLARATIPAEMSARSILPLLQGNQQSERNQVFLERERHANVRKGDLSYPSRAVRSKDFLYIRNLRPERWPAGDPEMHKAVGPYGDCDNSPAKTFILKNRDSENGAQYFALAFEKRPAEELYDLRADPAQTNNVATSPQFAAPKASLRQLLDTWMQNTDDPRVDEQNDVWSQYQYFGGSAPMPQSAPPN
jgi:arylsulfatase A-like enzyme